MAVWRPRSLRSTRRRRRRSPLATFDRVALDLRTAGWLGRRLVRESLQEAGYRARPRRRGRRLRLR